MRNESFVASLRFAKPKPVRLCFPNTNRTEKVMAPTRLRKLLPLKEQNSLMDASKKSKNNVVTS